MRKLILLTSILFTTTSVFSQITTLSDAELGFALDAAVPMSTLKTTQKTGLGGSAKFGMTIYSTRFAPTCTVGFLSFSGKEIPQDQTPFLKDTYKPVFFVAVKAGMRYTFPMGVYAEPQVGGTFSFSEDDMGNANNALGFTYAFNIGFQTLPGMDISARYEAVDFVNSTASLVGIRIGYHFTFRRQEIY